MYVSNDHVENLILQCPIFAVQLLEDEPFEAFKPTVERLIADKDQNKQRAAAEFLAGVLGGMG